MDHNFKWKLARLCVALAYMTLSTDTEFTNVTVGKDHVTEIVRLLEKEYTEAGLAAQAKAEEYDRLDPDEAPVLIEQIEYVMGKGEEQAVRLVKWLLDKGGATKAEIMTEFELSETKVMRPPSQKLIQLYKLLEADLKSILDRVRVLISERGKRGNRGNGQGFLP